MPGKDSITYFFLFHTIHDVLKAEKALKNQGCAFDLVPVPRDLSSDCGVCIRSEGETETITQLMFSLDLDRCFFFDGKAYVQHVDSDKPRPLGKEENSRDGSAG